MSRTAFGLDVEAPFDVPGLDEAVEPTGRRVALELVDGSEVFGTPGERIAEARDPAGRPVAAVDALADGGFRLSAESFGSAWASDDGAVVRCAPADAPAWRWQRFLTGQVLPFAAVLHGLEVFHASAVVLDGRALAVVAASGAGKTSVGLELVLRGLAFLNDDALVVERAGPAGVVAHPGPGLANVPRDGGDLVERLAAGGLGRRLGETEWEARVGLLRHAAPAPLGAVFYLERTASGERATVSRLAPVDPRLLLASTFNLALRGPDRLARQLDVCAAVAESSAIHRVVSPPSAGARAVAELVHEEALCSSAS